jgi:aminoglycoside/choline kinase family phosphotransferase
MIDMIQEDQRADGRLASLAQWVSEVLGHSALSIRPASTDASFRRYFRVQTGGASYIAMDAPPAHEDLGPYLRSAARFGALGLNVPKILHRDLARGFLLISDLGERLYLDHLEATTVERLYGDALSALIVLQAGSLTDPGFLPEYDAALLRREMELFRDWYLERHLGRSLTPAQQAAFETGMARLIQSALEQPQVWVHRDYHSRNLLWTAANNPGIVDFQDAVHGPVTYDLVSLLRDCYIAWPRAQVEDWALGYYDLAVQSGVPVGEDERRFLQWFDWMGVQRHLKASGIFARLHHRDGKAGYLKDIPRTLGYVLEVSGRYPALAPLYDLLCELQLPEVAT